MKCKFCFAELEENTSVCPMCGKQLDDPEEQTVESAEETLDTAEEEAAEVTEQITEEVEEKAPARVKKPLSKGLKIALACVSAVALLAVLAGAIIYSLKINLKPYENPVCYKTSYTVGETVAKRKNDVVVATAGDQELTNGQLQIYYQFCAVDFVNNYESTLSIMGLDTSLPFEDQEISEGKTFQHLFLENALESWRRQVTLVQMAEEAGFELSEEQQAELDSMDAQMLSWAKSSGYDDVDTFIAEQLTPGSTAADFLYYNRVNYIGLAYTASIYETMLPTHEELEEYFKDNESDFTSAGIQKDDSVQYYDVRHILIMPTGGTADDSGKVTISDAEWEECRKSAQAILDEFLAGDATEESFAALATMNSYDTGSTSNGGLYSMITAETNFVDEFKQWYMEEGRKTGDTGLIKTDYGYHVMYFSSSVPIWEYEARTAYLTDAISDMLEDAKEVYPMTIDYKKIGLSV